MEYIAFLGRTDQGSEYPRKAFQSRIATLMENSSVCVTARTDTGLVDSQHPMQSALALAFEDDGDNLLTFADILRHKIPADLAVLSACDTGRGRIYRSEGIVGLTQAFMLAGAPRVIVSLWRVDDDATRALMIEFYRLWRPERGKGFAAAKALRLAQAHIRTQSKWKHPYYWAAWVLWGLPD